MNYREDLSNVYEMCIMETYLDIQGVIWFMIKPAVSKECWLSKQGDKGTINHQPTIVPC